MDDLNHRVSDGFNRVDADLRSIRGERLWFGPRPLIP
jgi:hypothetical protein